MEQTAIRELASAMTRMYGPKKAFEWADRYAHEATTLGDGVMHGRWAAVAALLGEALANQERHGGGAMR